MKCRARLTRSHFAPMPIGQGVEDLAKAHLVGPHLVELIVSKLGPKLKP